MPVTEVIPAIIFTKNFLKLWYVIVYLWLTLISFVGIKLSSLYQLYSFIPCYGNFVCWKTCLQSQKSKSFKKV